MRYIAVAFAVLAGPLCPQTEQEAHRFSLYVPGLKAGTLQTVVTRNGKAFSVSATLSSTHFMR